MSAPELIAVIIALALLFDFVNGFHDAANSIATVVATRVLTPVQAVAMAATFNFFAALLLGTGVAATVGEGFVNMKFVTPYVILAGLLGAIIWNISTWYVGLPISSSHALIGGYAGAAVAKAGFAGLIAGKWLSTLAFIVLAPVIGLLLGYILMIALYWTFRRSTPAQMDRWFRHQNEHFHVAARRICTQPLNLPGAPIGSRPAKPSNSKKPWAVSESLVRNSASLWTWPGPNATSTNGNSANTSSLTDCAQQPPTPIDASGSSGFIRFASPRCATKRRRPSPGSSTC